MDVHDYKDFEKLLNSDCDEVKLLAHKALTYKQQFDAGNLSESDYDELLNDLSSLEAIDQNLVEVDVWNNLMKAIEVINKLRTLAII